MADTRNLVLEIGTEEIPARFCSPALEQLKENAAKALAEARLDYETVDVFGTPRRLVLYVRNLALRQRDVVVEVKGPPKKVAFDADGNFTVAARKFAEGQGVALEDLEVRADEKGGEYLWARKQIQGEPVEKVLPPLLAGLVTSIHWPKAMRWADREIRYARPIKWILALLGDWRVPFAVDGIETVTTTRGHRVLGPAEPIPVKDADDYFVKVSSGWVMVDQIVRKQVIWQQVTAEAARLGGFVRRDEDLLEELTWLVEQPTAFAGSFDPAFLEVPAEVLVTTMKEHQRYFPVYKAEDSDELLPYFIGIRNGGHEHLDIVRAGNEKVLAARLSDARFFWDEDRKQPLEAFNAKLKEAVFQEKLGTQFERVQRLVRLARPISQALGLPPEQQEQAARAAWLCKADLMTRMVFEFPEVQGYMGKQYLLSDGGDPAVAEAIYEHYLPRWAGDAVARTGPGIAVALADKLDTLAGYFSIGLIPTGSEDPFALRRAAQGVVQTLVENGLRVDLAHLVSLAIEQYGLSGEAAVKTHRDLMDFFRARVKVLLEQREIRYDVIDAVLAAGCRDVTDAVNRAEALAAVMKEPEFAAVTGAFKRVANLAGKAAPSGAAEAEVDPELFAEPAERELYGAFVELRPPMKQAYEAGEYREFYRLATRLKAPVDHFLDTVRVNVEDERVRANRYALLHALVGLLSAPADLSKLVV
ncbi:MAG: glycine--tRNA ligase subunit beta [Symbiobacteriaceae bacterium]